MKDGLMLMCGDDGVFQEYNEDYDIVIHCESEKERDETIEMMRNFPYPRWTPFSWRPLTEEEKKYHDDWCFITDSELPDDNQEILVSDGRNVWKDVFYNDGEIYFDSGSDVDDVKAWMPLPKPYKEEA